MGAKNFMTAKEKDYVAESLRRNMRYFRSDIDYAALFRQGQEKIEVRCDDEEPRRNINLVFGKENKKSSRRPRPYCGIDAQDTMQKVRNMLLLEELIDLYTVRRYCKLSEDDLRENIRMLRSGLLSKFGTLISTVKFLRFLGDYFSYIEEDERREIVHLLQKTFHLIEDMPEFYDMMGSLLNSIPLISETDLEDGFVSTFLFFPSGLILATSLLIQNEALCDIFYEATINEPSWPFTKNRYGWQFLSVMISLVSEEKQKSVVKKARPYLLEIARGPDDERMDGAMLFLKAIGADMDELKCYSE
ncbi:hypothetical protein KMI_09g14260 [Encephalitozoon hellem]|nr:hypothetical protein KMI_09g14260 [Encephalitozoon hellem]